MKQNKMSQESIIKMFKNRKGWKITKEYMKEDISIKNYYGIGLHAQYKNGYGLSIIAGHMLYSSPRKKAKEYTMVEVALTYNESLVSGKVTRKYFKDTVEPYITLDELKRFVKYVEHKKYEK